MINGTDLKSLHGKVVLVKSTRDIRNPPVAMRGTLDVREESEGGPMVTIEVDFPQMFTVPAHRRSLVLAEADIAHLLASEHNGTFEFTIHEELM
jgi:hypothetical protein